MTIYHSLEDSDLKLPSCDDLGIEVERTDGPRVIVRIAPEVARALAPLGVHSAEELAAYLNSFPSEVAKALGWEVKAVVRAREAAFRKLRGIVEDAFLDPPSKSWAYGALRPDHPSC
jgi:hypothetical protein